MKKMMRIAATVLVSMYLFACNKPVNKLAKYIPKDANIVFEVNSQGMLDKLSKANISLDSIAHALASDEDSSSAGRITYEDIKNSGIDIGQAAFAFAKSGGSIMAGQKSSGGLVAALKDASAFETFIKKQVPGKEIKKGENYSYIALGDDFIAGWGDNVLIIAKSSNGGGSAPGTYATGEGTLTQQLLTAMFAQKESESILSADGFGDMLKQNADVSFYANSSTVPSNPFIEMTKIADLVKGSYSYGTASFEDGKIAFSFTSHLSDAMTDVLKKYPARAIDVSMLDKYPSQMQGFLISSFNPQLLPTLLQTVGLSPVAATGLQQLNINLTVDDIFKALKGDFAIMASDFGMQTKTITQIGGFKLPEPSTQRVPTYKLLVNISIDKDGYNKVASALAQKGLLTQQNGQYQSSLLSSGGFVMNAANDNLYLASSADVLQQYTSGAATKPNMPADIHDKIKGKVFAAYVDFTAMAGKMPMGMHDEEMGADTSKASFKDMLVTVNNLDGKNTTGNMDIRLVNDKDNSLVTFLRFAIKHSHERKNWQMNMKGMGVPRMSDPLPPPPPAK